MAFATGHGGKKGHQDLQDVHRLHDAEQALPERLLPSAPNRPDHRFYCRGERLSFLDVYSGYNQIRLKVEDEDKTAFITPHGVYCYMTMPFGLKNAGATYQRCMQVCLKEQIGRNIKVCVDDIVIKTAKADSLLDDL
jgi:hypothetical protein